MRLAHSKSNLFKTQQKKLRKLTKLTALGNNIHLLKLRQPEDFLLLSIIIKTGWTRNPFTESSKIKGKKSRAFQSYPLDITLFLWKTSTSITILDLYKCNNSGTSRPRIFTFLTKKRLSWSKFFHRRKPKFSRTLTELVASKFSLYSTFTNGKSSTRVKLYASSAK